MGGQFGNYSRSLQSTHLDDLGREGSELSDMNTETLIANACARGTVKSALVSRSRRARTHPARLCTAG